MATLDFSELHLLISCLPALQSVLQMLMSSGSMNKLPDNLQWQIRTLLPRKDSKSQPMPMPVPEPAPVEVAPQQGFAAPHCPSPINLAAASLQLPLPAQVCHCLL